MGIRLARALCRWLPPLAAQRVRNRVWPLAEAQRAELFMKVRAVTGGWFEGKSNDIHAYPMLVHGYYEWRNVAICAAVLQAGETIVEVGANVGTETVCFADIARERGGRLVAFEPDECNFRALVRLGELNGWKHVELIQAAVSDHDGEARFEPPPANGMSGIGRVVTGTEKGESVAVRCLRLDTMFPDESGRVGAVFMDVEGHEVAVLRGAKALLTQQRPVVVLEAHPRLLARNGWDLAVLEAEVRDAGYMSWRIARFGLTPVDLASRRAGNWLCLPEEKRRLSRRVQGMLLRAGLLPMIPGVNPLGRASE